MRQQGVEEAQSVRTEREAAEGSSGVQSLVTNTRSTGATEGQITLGARVDRQSGLVGVEGDLFIEDETGWIYVYDGAWKYRAGVFTGTHAELAALTLDSTDEGALFLVKDVGVSHGLWAVVSGAFVREILPDSPDAATEYRVAGTRVVSSRQTGWAAATGTAARSTFDTATVTLPQLAEHVKALIDDFITHGAIGT
jgi:hypothetical protein